MRAHDVKHESMHFKRWSRKNWAVFNSLGKNIRIAALSISIIVALAPKQALSQTDTTKTVDSKQLEEVEITEEISTAISKNNLRLVQLIQSKDIASNPARSFAELLSTVTSIDIRQRGVNDAQFDVAMRGGTFEQVLILINGLRQNNPQTGHHNLDFPFDISLIERIEIVSGPASRVFGPNAFTGAINIVTKKPTNKDAQIILGAGSFSSFGSACNLGLKGKNTSNTISLNFFKTEGHTKNTDLNKGSAFYQGGIYKTRKFIDWQISYSSKDFGANSFYSAKYPDQYEETRALNMGANYKVSGKWTIAGNVIGNFHSDMFQLFRDGSETPSWYANHNYHLTSTMGITQSFSKLNRIGLFSIGANFLNEKILSNILGNKLLDTISGFVYQSSIYMRSANRNSMYGFVEQRFSISIIDVTIGSLIYYNDFSKNFDAFPGIDVQLKISPKTRLLLNANSSVRLPSFTELYYNGATNIGNANLVPEKNKSIDISILKKVGYFNFNATGYLTKSKNLIDWVRSSTSEKWKTSNISSALNAGADVSITIKSTSKPMQILKLDNLKLSASANKVIYNSQDLQSNYAADYIKLKLGLFAQQNIYNSLKASYNFVFVAREGEFPLYDSETKTEVMAKYGNQYIVDVALIYDFKNWSFQLTGRNLLNQKFHEIGNVPLPGLNVFGKLTFKI